MKHTRFVGLLLWLACTASFAQTRCPPIETYLLNKGFAESGPWRVVSGGAVQCTFMAKSSSVSFGFNHIVASTMEAATTASNDMRKAVAGTSLLEPMPVLGENGFAYQPKLPDGKVDPKSMFFFGQRGTVNVSGYLNLKDAITPAQRDFAAVLIAGTLRVATNPKALARATNCKYLDPDLVARLLPAGDLSSIVTDANNCVVSAGGSVITVAVTKDTRGWPMAERLLKNGGCTVDTLPGLGKGAGVAHHCKQGNPRAEVVVLTGSRKLALLFVPAAEPSAEEREALVELARFAARR